jgi:hypothetical protein
MIVIPWIMANSSWLLPTIGWGASEYLGWKSGGEKASVSMVLADFAKFVGTQFNKDQNDQNQGPK